MFIPCFIENDSAGSANTRRAVYFVFPSAVHALVHSQLSNIILLWTRELLAEHRPIFLLNNPVAAVLDIVSVCGA